MTSASPDAFQHALECNQRWAGDMCIHKSELMDRLSQTQTPQILWIGCSDSRCPETTLLGLQPGDVFVHRNIANILHSGDLSSQAVVAYAVGALKVKHVVVCGHTKCGGVAAALGNQSLGLLDAWLAPLKSLRAQLEGAMEGMDEGARARCLVEANVMAGVDLLRQNGTVIQAMKERGLQVHGCVYNVATGQVERLDATEDETAVLKRERVFGLVAS